MRLGVISDTHDRVPAIEKAVEIFNASNVDAVLHCGDFVSPFALLPFKNLEAPLYAVFGNNDGETDGIARLFSSNGWILNQRPWSFSLDGKTIAMLHEPDGIDEMAESGNYDLIVFGHTHQKSFETRNKTMLVNPGEGCGWVKGTATLAIVDISPESCVFQTIE
ncbi:MAG TPA: metallophosphoesterase [Nitrospirae bacterium]|nr:metallophosphoesterase [Nitrospirota bacterium]